MKRIFLIEDDYALAQAVKKQIESWGNEVVTARDFRNVMEEFAACDPQLVLVDVMLPFFNGYHWCTEIRKVSNVPIVFLSSAADNMNIVMAMNLGADDFIPKPVDPMVLTAKVSAILRRAYDLGEMPQELEHRGLKLNLGDNSVTVAEERVELTKNEFRILRTLLENKGRIVSRDRLMTALWQDDCYVEENTLTVNVNRLRKKLETLGLPGYITTKVGSGYIVE